jgi:hypothetical protein
VLVALTYETSLELAQLAGLVLTEPDVDAALTRVTQVAVSVVAQCDGASLTMRRAGCRPRPRRATTGRPASTSCSSSSRRAPA